MGSLEGDMGKKVATFERALSSIEKQVAPFVSAPLGDVVSRLTPTENAKLNMAYSYALNSLFYMYLKTQGVSPQDHPVKKELDRVKRYMAKTLAVDKSLKEKKEKVVEENTENKVEKEVESKTPESKKRKSTDTKKSQDSKKKKKNKKNKKR